MSKRIAKLIENSNYSEREFQALYSLYKYRCLSFDQLYALHYNKIAHCILSCSIELERLAKIRKMASISEKEVIVAMLSCGIAPESFDIASSPRKEVEDILSYKE